MTKSKALNYFCITTIITAKQENQICCDAKLQRAVVSEYKQATLLMVKKAAMSPKT
jgi:hypothetical protein